MPSSKDVSALESYVAGRLRALMRGKAHRVEVTEDGAVKHVAMSSRSVHHGQACQSWQWNWLSGGSDAVLGQGAGASPSRTACTVFGFVHTGWRRQARRIAGMSMGSAGVAGHGDAFTCGGVQWCD